MQAQNFHTPTYSEPDYSGGDFGLTYNANNATDTRSELGARFDRAILVNWNAVLALRGKVAWAATPAKNNALAAAGAELRLINGVSLLEVRWRVRRALADVAGTVRCGTFGDVRAFLLVPASRSPGAGDMLGRLACRRGGALTRGAPITVCPPVFADRLL